MTSLRNGALSVVVELRDPHRMDGGTHRGNPAVGQHLDVMDAVGVEGRHRAAGRGPEADDDGAQAPAVVTGGPGQRQGVQHGAVAGQLVVLVEHVQAEAAVAGPVVHRLEGDQRELLVDRQLGDGPVLDAVRPAPEDLPVAQFGQVLGLRLGQEDDVGLGQYLRAGGDAPHERRQLGVRDAETLAVAFLQDQLLPEFRGDAVQVEGMDREAALVRLPRGGKDSEGEVVHGAAHFFLAARRLGAGRLVQGAGRRCGVPLIGALFLDGLCGFLGCCLTGGFVSHDRSCSGTEEVPDFERYR